MILYFIYQFNVGFVSARLRQKLSISIHQIYVNFILNVILKFGFAVCFIKEKMYWEDNIPSIAQLVERLTVEFSLISGGPWFESGWTDAFCSRFYAL